MLRLFAKFMCYIGLHQIEYSGSADDIHLGVVCRWCGKRGRMDFHHHVTWDKD